MAASTPPPTPRSPGRTADLLSLSKILQSSQKRAPVRLMLGSIQCCDTASIMRATEAASLLCDTCWTGLDSINQILASRYESISISNVSLTDLLEQTNLTYVLISDFYLFIYFFLQLLISVLDPEVATGNLLDFAGGANTALVHSGKLQSDTDPFAVRNRPTENNNTVWVRPEAWGVWR